MSSAGMSGTSDPNTNDPLGMGGESGWNGTPSEAEVTGNAPLGTDPTLGEMPPDVVEVVEVVSTGPADTPMEMLDGLDLYSDGDTTGGGGFRWWYVPAVAVPLVAGGAVFWFARRRQTPSRARYGMLTRRGSDALDYLRVQTKRAPETASALRDRSMAVLGALAAADMARRAQELWATTRGSTGDLASRTRGRFGPAQGKSSARSTAPLRENFAEQFTALSDVIGPAAAAWIASLPLRQNQRRIPLLRRQRAARQMRKQLQRRADQMLSRGAVTAMPAKVAAQAGQSIAPLTARAADAGVKTRQAVLQTGKSVNSAWRRTRAFGFGVLVAAMTTYVAMWRRRLTEREMRETASGRLEPDREPTFSR